MIMRRTNAKGWPTLAIYVLVGAALLLWGHNTVRVQSEDAKFAAGGVPRAWLQQRVSLQAVDQEHGASEDWRRARPKIKPDDQIWAFSTPRRYGNGLAGEQGYVVYRGDK